MRERYPLRCALFIVTALILGLASRKFSHSLPWWMAKSAASLFCFGIEFLKFCTVPWLVATRESTAGALVLGHGFHASNLVCYLLGIFLAAGIETLLKGKPA